MENSADSDKEPVSYVIPTVTIREAPPFFLVQEECSAAVKDIVAQTNKILENVRAQSNDDEFRKFVQKRLAQTREVIFAQIKKEDQDIDKRLVKKEVLGICAKEGFAKPFTNFRFHVAVKGAPIGKGVVVRINPRSGDAYVWQMPQAGQEQHEAKILIVNSKYQNEVLARAFVIGERTDGLTAGKRGG